MSNHNDHIDSFEQFLKETTESFRMIPSRKVWTSIYNNIHPRKIWPAFSTNFILFICLLLLQLPKKMKVVDMQDSIKHHAKLCPENISLDYSSPKTNIHTTSVEINSSQQKSVKLELNSDFSPVYLNQETVDQDHNKEITSSNSYPIYVDFSQQNSPSPFQLSGFLPHSKKNERNRNEYTASTVKIGNRISHPYLFQVYATPGIGFSQLYDNEQNMNNSAFGTVNGSGNNAGVSNTNIRSTLNLEAGGAVLMNISKIVRLKAGMQVNYTHIDDVQSEDYASNTLNNTTIGYTNNTQLFQRDKNQVNDAELYQISLPIGSEIEITGNDKFRWYAGATIQPSYLMNAESQDETTLNSRDALFGLRKWNLNTSIETYLSYKMKNGVILNIGPQFRYQWLSTYNQPLMSGMDRLYNIGLKLGVSGNF